MERCYEIDLNPRHNISDLSQKARQVIFFPITPEERMKIARVNFNLPYPYNPQEFTSIYSRLTDEREKICAKYSVSLENILAGKKPVLSYRERLQKLIEATQSSPLKQAYYTEIKDTKTGEIISGFYPRQGNEGIETEFDLI